ncbi:hypothetical protein M6B38_324230 [Iris pallida]|uniref:Uncharacterized protein n=1 Tax=Iris pallida TaxID=29817 RepID=A0AAX6H858_IRIPA|nr:hypothetical protein M6B38_324230 [Iris pallida]
MMWRIYKCYCNIASIVKIHELSNALKVNDDITFYQLCAGASFSLRGANEEKLTPKWYRDYGWRVIF